MASQQEIKMSNEKALETHNPEICYSGSKAMPYIIGNEICEKLGSLGTLNNMLVYFTTVFNMKAITATTLVNTFNGTANLAALPASILCDTYFGRYKTLGFASVAAFLGMSVLTLTAANPKLHPSQCKDPVKSVENTCHGPTSWQMAILLCGLGLMVIGAGGIRPCNLAFGADQFDPNTQSGQKGIKRFFKLYYFSLTCATMISLTIVAYVQSEMSWALGLAIPAMLMLFSVVFFFVGSKVYVRVEPEGTPTPLISAVRVIVAAFKKRRLTSPEQPWLSLFNHVKSNSINSRVLYTDQFRFLDKAAIIDHDHDTTNPDGSSTNPWKLSTMQQVEETKCLLRVAPIWTTSILYYIATIQQHTFVVFQALQSNRNLGHTSFEIPAVTYTAFIMLAVTIWIPTYERIIAPALLKFPTKKGGGVTLTLLQKMACGMVLSILAMLISAFVEEKRRSLALTSLIGRDDKRGLISPHSGFWLVPQLTLIGFSEALTVISYIEFYYHQVPEDMRSVSGSFIYVGFAVSSYLNNLLISLVQHMTKGESKWISEDLNEGKLDWFYYFVAVLQVVNLGYFIVCAKWYKYKVNTTNDVSEVLV